MKKTALIITTIFILLAAVLGVYWYLFFHGPGARVTQSPTNSNTTVTNAGGFSPFGRIAGNGTASTTVTTQAAPSPSGNPVASQTNFPRLRLLSNTPVGGYAASSSNTATVVRWIDRGRGNVLESAMGDSVVTTLSNTIIPRVFDSVWNKNLTAFIASMLPGDIDDPVTVYSELRKSSSTTAASVGDAVVHTPYELKGKNLPSTVVTFAASPDHSRIFLYSIENGRGVGYVANFDGTKMTQLFDTPITQVNVEWPETNTIAITTKGSAGQSGYLYFVNAKTGTWTKILGPIAGLSTRVSHDAKYIIASSANHDSQMDTAIYTVASSSLADAVVRTLADKCVWANVAKNIVYCAAPASSIPGTYPDDWYRGTVSFVDKIWQINAQTGEVHLVSNIVDSSDRVIDAFNLGLDPKDEYLFFMNKNDLSLWSLDLIASH